MKDAANHSWLKPELRRCMNGVHPLSGFLGMQGRQIVSTVGQSTGHVKPLRRQLSAPTGVGLAAMQHFIGRASTDPGLTAATVIHTITNSTATVSSTEVHSEVINDCACLYCGFISLVYLCAHHCTASLERGILCNSGCILITPTVSCHCCNSCFGPHNIKG